MHLLIVCLSLAVSSTASSSPAELTGSSTNTSFYSMPVQFSMAAPLPLVPHDSADWSPSSSTSISSRRGYHGPPRPHRRKHRPSYEEMMHMFAMRRQRIYPRYPPSLEPYSHNYKQSKLHRPVPPNYYFRPAAHRFPLEHRPQHNYVEYPPYASQYPPPTGNDHLESTRHQPSHEQQPQHAPYHQGEIQQHHQQLSGEFSQSSPQFQHNDPNSHLNNYPGPSAEYEQHLSQFNSQNSHPNNFQGQSTEYHQHPSQLNNQNSHPNNFQGQNTEYHQHPSQFNNQISHPNNFQGPNTEYHQHPSQFLSNEQSYPPKHQTHNFEYPHLPPDYETGETFSQFPNENYQHIPEPHIPHYPSSEYTGVGGSMYSGPHQPSQMQPHANYQPHAASAPPPEYNPEMDKELLELNKEMGLMQQDGHSDKSILHLLVPLLMLGISIPAIGYIYSHMIRRRSFQDWSSEDTMKEYMELLQRGIECYQHKGQCSVS